MKALLKIEWIKTWRSWPVFIMGISLVYFGLYCSRNRTCILYQVS